MSMILRAVVCLGILLGGEVVDGAVPFQDGDRVCFVGDSITKQGGYHAQIQLFYATRLPGARLQMWNCGIAGNTAAGGVKRYDWDIAPHKPTVVSVMMGMNDVGRGYYAGKNADKTVLTRRQQAIDRNIANMDKIVERVTGDGARAILITPSLYDQTGQQEAECLFGVNDALRACADGVREIAKRHAGVDVIEFNVPMATINAEWQTRDPNFTVVGKDRVHPGAVGHLVMAYLFLKALAVGRLVTERHELENRVRTYALLKQQFLPDQEKVTPAMEREILEKNLEKLKGKDGRWNDYRREMIESYLGTAGGEAAVEEQCARLMDQIYEMNRPQRHHYELVRIGE